ncbi:Vegetative incompatibility protein HET-E-1 [Colletotrichum siamense]|uniref:Vegetative incompatibility protein HET-E-1 n=1 Tax=Colletotrichum siamense TaxID=690259 RepID=UPI0018731A96|nr:Vegetative incompatibility protein HET-E-1 [Colletotrichum siamense]KAF5501329.1 Vegetative incompatibility protein HET-E-1 [Colletotrichum siamense]
MDPASAFGLAASIVQTITFASDLISKSRQLHHSAQRGLVEDEELASIARTLQSHSRRITIQLVGAPMGKDDVGKDLSTLCNGVRDLCKNLLDTIEALQKPDSATRWDSFTQALRSVWKEQDIADLAQRLERYRRQIDSILLASMKEQLETLTKDTRDRNQQIEQNLNKILAIVEPKSRWQAELAQTARRSLDSGPSEGLAYLDLVSASLSAGAKEERDKLMQRRTLESLKFADIRDRYERIPVAHRKTFEWIFSEPSTSPAEGRNPPWDNFHGWLTSDEVLYWVTGKPGSGKSTLMKFLSDDARLRPQLGGWQKDIPVHIASFFFWNSGTMMQMSREGLLRSLLHQTIRNFPQDIPKLFPERWEYQELFGYDSRSWSWSELSQAFTEMLSDKIKAFFFIVDGLDELDGDCSEMTSYLLRAFSQGPHIKACVSSRPWLVFENSFRRKPSLKMEDFTKKDITLFATEKLTENTTFAQLQRLDDKGARALIDEVSRKASGVFLWVTLVVKSLLEGLRDGDKIQDLRSRLDDLPPDLQSLFRKLLEDLEPSYFQQSSRIFQSVRASHLPRASIAVGEYKSIEVKGDSHEAWSSLRLLSLSFIDEDPEEALGNDSQGTMGRHEQGYRAEVMRRQLQSRCKGLLEVPTFSTIGPESKVEYLHRTVKDFLEEGGGGDFLTTEDSFDPHVVLCAALIRHARAIRPTEDDMTGMESLADILREFTTQCHWLERQNRDVYVPYLEEMNKIAEAILGGPGGDKPPPDSSQTDWVFSFPHWTRRVDPYVGRKAARVWCLFDYAVVRSLTQYVRRQLSTGYSLKDNPNHKFLTEYVLEHGTRAMAELLDLGIITSKEIKGKSSGNEKGVEIEKAEGLTREMGSEKTVARNPSTKREKDWSTSRFRHSIHQISQRFSLRRKK